MGQFFMYVSVVEGVVIALLLSWEIFWLSRMYNILKNMPTANQLQDMVDAINKERDMLASVFSDIGNRVKLIAQELYSYYFGGKR